MSAQLRLKKKTPLEVAKMMQHTRQEEADRLVCQTIMDGPCLEVGEKMWTAVGNPFKKKTDYMFAFHPKLEHSILNGKVAWGCKIDEIMVDGSIRVKWFDENPTCRLVSNKSVWRAPPNHPIIPLIMPSAEDGPEDDHVDDESPAKKMSQKVSKKHKSKQDKSVQKAKRKHAVEEHAPPHKKGRVVLDEEVGEASQPQRKKPVASQRQPKKLASPKEVDDTEKDAEWGEAYANYSEIMEGVQKVGSWLGSSKNKHPLAGGSSVFARDVDYDKLVEKHKVIKAQLAAAREELKNFQDSTAFANLAAESELAKVKSDAADATTAAAARLAESEERNTKLMEKMATLEQKVKQLNALKQLSRDDLQLNSRARSQAAPVFTLNHRASRDFVDRNEIPACSSTGKKGKKG